MVKNTTVYDSIMTSRFSFNSKESIVHFKLPRGLLADALRILRWGDSSYLGRLNVAKSCKEKEGTQGDAIDSKRARRRDLKIL